MMVMTTPQDPQVLLRSKSYLRLLILAAVLGVPVSAAAYGFLQLVAYLQGEVFTHLPNGLGFHGAPPWWPLPVLTVAGLLVAPVIRFLPGKGGHSPADGFKAGEGAPTPAQLPGVLLAALATLSLGVVLGPEAPLIALGGGLAVLAVRLARRDMPAQATAVVAAAGSFAAVSTLLGSPIAGAFLLMEASGLGGPMLGVVLLPGLLASGVGALIFVGLDSLDRVRHIFPVRAGPAPFRAARHRGVRLGPGDRGRGGHRGHGDPSARPPLRPHVERRILLLTPVVGMAIAGLTIAYTEGTGKSFSDVLFSGQSQLGPLIDHAASYSVGALLLLLACKGLAYGASLSSFRGGPTFPALYLGAAGGIALSHLPGLPLVPGVAMGIGAMCAVMLRLPLTSVLLTSLLLYSDGLAVMPLVIVAVVVAYVVSARFVPAPAPASGPAPGPASDAPADGAPAGSRARAGHGAGSPR